MSLAPAEWRAV